MPQKKEQSLRRPWDGHADNPASARASGIGAEKNFNRKESDLLVIGSNQEPIHASQTAFYAILVEMDRRGGEEERRDGEE